MSDSFYFPVFTGILTKEHKENIGPALWEFLWLVAKTTKEVTKNGETIGVVLGGKPIKISELANDLGSNERSVRRNLSRLKEHNYVKTTRTPYGEVYKVRNSKKFVKNRKSKIKEVPNMNERADKNVPSDLGEIGQKRPRDRTEMSERTDKSVLSNKIERIEKDRKNIYVEIINYLNKKAGKRFSAKSAANKKLINGRISEGRTFDDFKHVIDVKCEDWLGDPKWGEYLRPSTLFRPTNFENYLNQKMNSNKENTQFDSRDKEIEFQKWVTEGNEPSEFNWTS